MCGNGGRCVSRFAYLKGIAGPDLTFETKAGPISAEVRDRLVKVLIPKPAGLLMDLDLELQPDWKHVDFINTGVPHVVIGVDNLRAYPVVEQGRALRYHQRFSPEGTNVNFIDVRGENSLDVRTYERGVEDETLACGTGSIASALVSSVRGLVHSPVQVNTRGGEALSIYFKSRDREFEEVWLEGSTSLIYEGRLNKEAVINHDGA
jgi:diaminopimelate epimerase